MFKGGAEPTNCGLKKVVCEVVVRVKKDASSSVTLGRQTSRPFFFVFHLVEGNPSL
jgi:hypothetical protein